MTPAYTKHKLVRKKDTVDPGTVIELDEKEFKELESVGAVRKPTETELELFEMSQKPKKAAAKAKAAAKPKADAKAKKDAEAKDAAAAGEGNDTAAAGEGNDTAAAGDENDLLGS